MSRDNLATLRQVLHDYAGSAITLTLALVFLWFGAMKFTEYEAKAIEGLVANSPFVSFLLPLLGTQGTSYLIGIVELSIAALLASRFLGFPALAAVGAGGAALTFLLTISFFFTTPGVFLTDVGPLAISVLPGQFLLQDLVLIAASLWALDEALTAAGR